jgi:hypothetical protein
MHHRCITLAESTTSPGVTATWPLALRRLVERKTDASTTTRVGSERRLLTEDAFGVAALGGIEVQATGLPVLFGRYHADILPAASAVGCEARFGGSLRF